VKQVQLKIRARLRAIFQTSKRRVGPRPQQERFAAFFALLRWGLDWTLARWGTHWQIRDVSDPAVLPLAALILGALFFLATPIQNTLVRTQEYEADIFGLNTSRQPDGFAESALLLGEYRKLDPGKWEEAIFFDHPSGHTRIFSAMRWKAENQCLSTAVNPCSAQH
jgi:STE24 endopeptidase